MEKEIAEQIVGFAAQGLTVTFIPALIVHRCNKHLRKEAT